MTMSLSAAVLLRDRLQARLAEMGESPDYIRLADEVLAIRNAPEPLARKLVAQALVIEDRRDVWARVGDRVCTAAPETPGVYVFRDAAGAPLYVGKALNLRRRLRAHFARHRWRALKAEVARVADVEWREVGSELEALLREAQWIRALAPTANVQVGAPSIDARAIPSAIVREVVVILPSVAPDSVELVAARTAGPVLLRRTRRDGADLDDGAAHVWNFLHVEADTQEPERMLAAASPIVFSWLAGRGASATRVDVHSFETAGDLRSWLEMALGSRDLFTERLILRWA